MAGVNFGQVRKMFTIEEVLEKLGWQPIRRRGSQLRGDCPVCGNGRVFSVNIETGRFFCHRCKTRGNVLELWMAVTNLSIYEAAIDLCNTFSRALPRVKRW